MTRITRYLAVILLAGLTGCSTYILQTPQVVPQGKVAGGVGLAGLTISDVSIPFAIPGFWVRAGVAPNLDIGVHSWGLGLKVDGKYSFSDWFGLGAGVSFASFGVLLYGGEASLYAGIPGKVLYPYGAARLSIFGATETLTGNNNWVGLSTFKTVLGLRLRLGEMFSLYGEGGLGVPLEIGSAVGSIDGFNPGFVYGLGVSVGN